MLKVTNIDFFTQESSLPAYPIFMHIFSVAFVYRNGLNYRNES